MLYMSHDVAKLPAHELSAATGPARRSTPGHYRAPTPHRFGLRLPQVGHATSVLSLRPERDAREHELPDDAHGGGQHGRRRPPHASASRQTRTYPPLIIRCDKRS